MPGRRHFGMLVVNQTAADLIFVCSILGAVWPSDTLTQPRQPDGDPMLEHDTYRQLATLNGLIVETRSWVTAQRRRQQQMLLNCE
jgi:hypothetical protein